MCLWQDEAAELYFDYDRKEAKTHGDGQRGQGQVRHRGPDSGGPRS